MNQPATIGHNAPPTACEVFKDDIDMWFEEAKNYLDGKPIETVEQHDAYTKIMDAMKELVRDADKTRLAENKPYRDAEKANNAKWKEAVTPATLTIVEAEKPLTIWRVEQRRIADEKAANLRKEAEQKEREAQEARQRATSLEEAEAAEALLKSASISQKTANKIDRIASGLRTSWDAQVIDYGALLKWMKADRQNDLMEFLNTYAQRNVEIAKAGNMPGVVAQQVRRAV